MTQTFFYFTHSDAPVHFAGASFVLAAIVATLSLIPLIIGLKTVPKIAETGGPPPDAEKAHLPGIAPGDDEGRSSSVRQW